MTCKSTCLVLRFFFSWGRQFVLCCGSRIEALVGFVAEKLSQVLGNLIVNLFGTELMFFTNERVCAVLPEFATPALNSVR